MNAPFLNAPGVLQHAGGDLFQPMKIMTAMVRTIKVMVSTRNVFSFMSTPFHASFGVVNE